MFNRCCGLIEKTSKFMGRRWGVYKLWLKYLLNINTPRISFVKGFAYRFFLTNPSYVFSIVSGFCPICGKWIKSKLNIYYHLTWNNSCARQLFKLFNTTFTCGLVDRDLVDLLFPSDVFRVYKEYARHVISSGMRFNKFDGFRMYVNFFYPERCDFRSVDVAYEYWYQRGWGRGESGEVQVQEVQ